MKIRWIRRLCIAVSAVIGLSLMPMIPGAAAKKDAATIEEELQDEEYRRKIIDLYGLEEISREYNVDLDDVVDAAIRGEGEDKFSPFTEYPFVNNQEAQENQAEAEEETTAGKEDTITEGSPAGEIERAGLEHIVYNQDSTAYLGTGNPGASGTMPWVGSCAVHAASAGNPLIPYGLTVYYLNRSVTISGVSYSSFVVNDIGDLTNVRSLYWTDLYFGDDTAANETAAYQYGVKNDVTLYWLR